MEKNNQIQKKENGQLDEREKRIFALVDLSRYPYFIRVYKKDKRKYYKYTEPREQGTFVWEIVSPSFLPNGKEGYLPGIYEWKCYLWMLNKISKVLQETGQIPKVIDFSLYEIAEFWGERNHILFRDALYNLTATTISARIEDAPYKPFVAFSLIDALNFAEKRDRAKGKKIEPDKIRGKIVLSEGTYQLLCMGRVKPNAIETWKKLGEKNLSSASLYEFLSSVYASNRKNGIEKEVIEFWYDELVKRLGLTEFHYVARIEQQLKPIADALKKEGIIKEMAIQKIIDDTKGVKFRVIFYIGEKLKKEVEENLQMIEHKNIVEQLVNGKKESLTEEIEKEVEYWQKEIERELGIVSESVKFLLRKAIMKKTNYVELFLRAISEVKQNSPENKTAYLITLIQKFFEFESENNK